MTEQTNATPVWTTIRIGLSKGQDHRTLSLFRMDLRGAVPRTEALHRAITHINADRNLQREYLLNCINLGNYLIYDTNEGEPAIDISAHNPPSTPVATATIATTQ